jgi:hypothetical protein
LELARQLMQAYYEQQSEVVDPPALINGNDLISVFELSPGPEIGDLLEQIREAQAAGDLSDRQAALAWVHRALHGGPSA